LKLMGIGYMPGGWAMAPGNDPAKADRSGANKSQKERAAWKTQEADRQRIIGIL
jgi:hypothetical protein